MRHPAGDHVAAAEPQHEQLRDAHEESPCSDRRSPAAGSGAGCDRRIPGWRARKRLELARLLPVGADDAHAGQRFLRHRADIRQLRLDALEALVDQRGRSSAR